MLCSIYYLENIPKQIHTPLGLKSCFYNSITELAWVVDAMRIYILMIKVKEFILFFVSQYFLKEIENMFSLFLSSYTNMSESLGELKKAVETLTCGSCSHSISRSSKLSLVFL